jgi:putative spermidine/putrescine transport system permease protein
MRSEPYPLPRASTGLKLATLAGVLFLHVPLALIILYAFSSEDKSYVFPPPGLTTQWFAVALAREDVWSAVGLSVQVALWSTGIALILGTFAAGALARFRCC